MPGIKYIPTPIVAWPFKPGDAAQKKELSGLGLDYINDTGDMIAPDGTPLSVNEGDYIIQKPDGTFNTASKDYFESRYTKFS